MNNKFIRKDKSTGRCEINIDVVCRDWVRMPRLWIISKFHNKFRLIRLLRKDSMIEKHKIEIESNIAEILIKKLKLIEMKSTIYKNASAFKMRLQADSIIIQNKQFDEDVAKIINDNIWDFI